MSRLENKKKAGYFPTPDEVTRRIARHLTPPVHGGTQGGTSFRWADPCAGEGTALAYLASQLGGRTFGIELDKERAEAAAQVLDRVISGDFAAARLPKSEPGVSVLFLNPPYDHDDDQAGGRLELTFLRESQDWLMPGGVLIYIIPDYRITTHIARRLATHFRDVRVYRFPYPEYDQFRQVVIFAVKRDEPQKDERLEGEILAARSWAPTLPSSADRRYHIPPQPDTPFYFRYAEADPADVAAEAARSGCLTTKAWTDLVTPTDPSPRPRGGQGGAIQPLMPLRRGHVAMVLAAGLLDNMQVQRDGKRLLVKGRLQKVHREITTEQDRDKGLVRTREEFQASIATLDLDTGKFETIAGDHKLRSWLTEWQEVLAARIVEQFKPLHQMTYDDLPGFVEITAQHSKHRHLPGRQRTGLFEAQRQVVAALTRRFLARERFAFLQATMGTGKTTIAISLADVLKKYLSPRKHFPVMVTCPPHLVEKWPREIAGVVPMARATVIRRPSDLEAYMRELRHLDPHTLSVAVVSSEMLKLGSGWTPAVVTRRRPLTADGRPPSQEGSAAVGGRRSPRLRSGQAAVVVFCCPRCGHKVHETDESGQETVPTTDPEHFARRRLKCQGQVRKWVGDPSGDGSKGHWEWRTCGEPLYQEWRGHWPEPERDGFGNLLPLSEVRYPIAEYIKRRHARAFDLTIIDECHEYKGQSTDRGHAFATLARASKRTLAMTGTLFGGFATSLFYLLHRLDPRVRSEFSWSDGQRFAALYGVLERVSKRKTDDTGYGHYTGLRRARTYVREKPGISPALVTRLLDSTVFLTLEDLGFELPDYREHPVILDMRKGDASPGDGGGRGPDQAEVYHRIHEVMRQAAMEDWSLMSEYLQTTLAWPNAPWREEETSVGTFGALPADVLYPKEEWLVQKCRAEVKGRGRRVLLFVRQTATRDIQPRLAQILTQAGLNVVILRGSVPTHRREAWVQRKLKEGLDVMVCNPRLVATGLDLVAFPTVIFYEPEYSIYLVQQASRRTWRLGQTQPVDVYFAVYADTTECRAVSHIGRKLTAAKLLYGDDVAGALVEQAGVGGNLLEELAREVMGNSEVPDLGEVFVQKSHAYEGGWLGAHVDLADRPAEVARPLPPPPLEPVSGSQLSLF